MNEFNFFRAVFSSQGFRLDFSPETMQAVDSLLRLKKSRTQWIRAVVDDNSDQKIISRSFEEYYKNFCEHLGISPESDAELKEAPDSQIGKKIYKEYFFMLERLKDILFGKGKHTFLMHEHEDRLKYEKYAEKLKSAFIALMGETLPFLDGKLSAYIADEQEKQMRIGSNENFHAS